MSALWYAVEVLVSLDGRQLPSARWLRERRSRWVEVDRSLDGANMAALCRHLTEQAKARNGRRWWQEEQSHRVVALWPGLEGAEVCEEVCLEDLEPQADEPTPAPAPRPTLYLTNPAGLKVGRGGPGQAHLITIAPPGWLLSVSDRLCPMGTPPSVQMMMAAKKGTLPLDAYEAACRRRWSAHRERLSPGRLLAMDARAWLDRDRTPLHERPVADGDTLLCTCGAGQPCHRRWFAEVLHAEGWRIVLDGAELLDGQAPALPSEEGCPGPQLPQVQPSPGGLQLSLLGPPAASPVPSVASSEATGPGLGSMQNTPPASPVLAERADVGAPAAAEPQGAEQTRLRASPIPRVEPDDDDDEEPFPLRAPCWRVIENIDYPRQFIDLPLEVGEQAAWAKVRERVLVTGRAWRLFLISDRGAWTSKGLALSPAQLHTRRAA